MSGDSRRSQMCHKRCSTCIQCTASGKSSQRPSSQQWTAGTKDVLKRRPEKKNYWIIWSRSCRNLEFHLSLSHTWPPTIRAGHQLLRLACFLVHAGVAQAKVTVVIRQCQAIWSFLRGCKKRIKSTLGPLYYFYWHKYSISISKLMWL